MPTALITGASSGLGSVFARKLAARGYDLMLTARREDRMRQLAAELPVKVDILKADLATEEGIAIVASAIRATATLDLLVNNAGFGTMGRFWTTDFAQQQAMHTVHVIATLALTRAALEGMVQRRRGAILNVSSVAGFAQSDGNVSYCATKAWMNSFTQGLEMELRAANSPVKVQALCPGFTHTEFHDTAAFDKSKIPSSLWLDADLVVEESLRGLDQGRTFVIPDWKYKLAVAISRHVPLRFRQFVRRPDKWRQT